jgi:catechol 2,3-dioxygenase-like lactoylglutathione lyase family enzyme
VPEQSPLSHDDLYHTGFVVDDLEAAQERFGSLLGASWLTGGGTVQIRTPDGSSVVETKYALSAEGPHHVELVQSVPGTLYLASGSASAHHLGYWVDDVTAASEALEKWGMPCAASVGIEGSRRGPMAAYHRAGEGSYLEVVARSMRRVLFPATREC